MLTTWVNRGLLSYSLTRFCVFSPKSQGDFLTISFFPQIGWSVKCKHSSVISRFRSGLHASVRSSVILRSGLAFFLLSTICEDFRLFLRSSILGCDDHRFPTVVIIDFRRRCLANRFSFLRSVTCTRVRPSTRISDFYFFLKLHRVKRFQGFPTQITDFQTATFQIATDSW